LKLDPQNLFVNNFLTNGVQTKILFKNVQTKID